MNEPQSSLHRPGKEGVSRRTFVLATGAAALALFGLGGTAVASQGSLAVRPPGAQDESAFLAACNRCGRCVNVCHTQAIGFASVAEGLMGVRTPVMRFNLGECDFCGDCFRVCPTKAIKPFNIEAARSGDVSSARIGVAELSRDTCLAWTSASCNLCISECPYGAIEADEENHPAIIPEKCNGCGVCEHACPVLSLRSYIGGTARAITVKPVETASRKEGGEGA